MRICCKLGFQPFNNSNGVFGTTLVETRFNVYIVVLSASVHKNLRSFELLSILLTMSNKVQFLLFATPFWSGEPGTESFPPFSARLFGLKNAGFKNE